MFIFVGSIILRDILLIVGFGLLRDDSFLYEESEDDFEGNIFYFD